MKLLTNDQLIRRTVIVIVATLVVVSAVGRASRSQMTVIAGDPDLGKSPFQEPGTTGSAAASGTVVDATTGAAIAGAVVRVTRLGNGAPSTIQSVICDSKGRFVFTQLPEGSRLAVEADQAGYSRGLYGRHEPNQPDSETQIPVVSLRAMEWRRDLEIRMWRLSNINGHVLDDHGEPLVGVAVRAFILVAVGGRRYLASAGLASSDDRGFYRLKDLGPGTYLVGIANSQATVLDSTPEAEPRRPLGALITGGPPDAGEASVRAPTFFLSPGRRVVANSLSVAPGTERTLKTYAPVFYPNARSPGDGQTVVLAPGTSRRGIDFQLEPVATFQVSGRASVHTALRDPPLLRLVPRGFEELGLGNEVATTVLGPDGSFAFVGVPAGEYTLLAVAGSLEFARVGTSSPRLPDPPGLPEGVSGSGLVAGTNLRFNLRSGRASTVWARQPVSVVDGNVSDFSLELKPTVRLRGRIEFEAGTEVPRGLRAIAVNAEPANRDPALGASSAYAEIGTDPLSFSIDGLVPGTYMVGSSSMTVLSTTWHGRDVTDLGVDANEDIDGLVITLTSKTTEVTGMVTGRVDARAAVIAFPADSRLWSTYGWTPRRLRSVPVQASGAYAVRNLPAGEYFLIAVDQRVATSWTDPAFLRAASAQAVRISVRWGVRTDRNLVLQQEPSRK